MSRIAVLGGGISGLACAYYLAKFGGSTFKQILLLESSHRLGGWIHSKKSNDGAIHELGPRSLRGFGKVSAVSLELAEDLGLTDDIIPVLSNHIAAKNRYIYARKQLYVLPSSPWSMLKRSSLLGESLAYRLLKEIYTKPEQLDDDTIHNFMKRRFGSKIADLLVDPFVRGVFAGDCRQLSMKSCLPDVFDHEQEHGSVVRGAVKTEKVPLPDSALVRRSRAEKWSVWSLRNGLGQLSDKLVAHLGAMDNVNVRIGTPCRGLMFGDNGQVKVKTDDGDIEVDRVVAATNSKHLSAILPQSLSSLAAMLAEIEYVTVGVVNLEYSGHVLQHQGFGHLVPSSEPSNVLGVVYDSCAFPDHDRPGEPTTRLTCMMGGAWFRQLFGEPSTVSTERLEQTALDAVREQLGVQTEPRRVRVTVQEDCIPQYRVGHSKLLQNIQSELINQELPLHLIGAPYQGVSVNDCIHNAKLAARRISELMES